MNKELLELFRNLTTGCIVGRKPHESDYCVRLSQKDVELIITALDEYLDEHHE